ncbi:RDD family protein [Candidatus Albibeggiatoa sp. nov. BB20]|uniref:RDD family protein n=1 Tax=Candidatus Albibeggiatoa sp. nov. BB20 TaxID=3162723 RepID=UPI0033655B41
MENYYEILGVSRHASVDEIKQATQHHIQLIKTAYATLSDTEKRQAYEANPAEIDYYALLNTDSSATSTRLKVTAQEKLNTLKSMYQVLSNPEKREAYDATTLNNESQSDDVDLSGSSSGEDNPYAAPDTVMTDMSIDSEFELASRSSRFGAYIFDMIIYMIPITLTIIAILVLEDMVQFDSFESGEDLISSPFALAYFGFLGISMIVIFILNLVYLYRNGQTIGKRVLGIKIIRTDYTRAGLARIIFLRYFIMGMIGGIPLIGLIITLVNYLIIFGKPRRCLHDYIADTIVVKVK